MTSLARVGATGSMPVAPTPVLELTSVQKTFGQTQVLDVQGVTLRSGSVYGLLGANGSGKSTLVKILSGYHRPDSGSEGRLRGIPISWPIKQAGSGIAVVQQDYALIEDVSITENFLAQRASRRSLLSTVNWREEHARTLQSLSVLGVVLDPRALVSSLTPAQRALVAIGRAVEQLGSDDLSGKLLILDEPTANLGNADVARVLTAVRDYAASGACVIVVNHRMPEVRACADEVIVLREGRLALAGPQGQFDDDQLVRAMFAVASERPSHGDTTGSQPAVPHGGGVLALTWPASAGGEPARHCFWPGEVVGVAGLIGMGQDHLPYQIVGAAPRRGLSVEMDGRILEGGPVQAKQRGLILVPADRARDGLWLNGAVRENFTITRLAHMRVNKLLSGQAERRATSSACREWAVVYGGPEAEMWTLSGGNQQKVALARAVASEPWEVLLVHEPTQGVDIATRAAIHVALVDLAHRRGKCVVVFGSDYDSLATVSDRVLVMNSGRVVQEITGDELSEDAIATASMNVQTRAPAPPKTEGDPNA